MRTLQANWFTSRFVIVLLLLLPSNASRSADAAAGETIPESLASIPEPEIALKQFLVAPGLKVQIAASEPLIQNVVSFCFDEKGRIYAVETHRRRTSVFDIRNHPDWLDADLSFRTVDDRINFLKKALIPENKSLPKQIVQDRNGDGKFDWHDLEVESERIRLLQDKDGDGRMDAAVTFSEGYNTLVSGVAAGILSRGSNVWFTCLPDLWQLEDTDGDGKADVRKQLLHGFGVHIGFGGHDLHGLCFGPDGRLYFSVGDRGMHVQTKYSPVALPQTGAILRCEPDGSGLEVYASGLRNPQELAFDQYGNLWTGDNNGDGGDKARWIYVVERGDSGWTIGWQWLPKMGAWNSEKLWHLAPTNTAAYLLPPIAHIGHGPAGLAFYPGTGMPPQYDNHFFMCDFPGGVRSFTVAPKGASYVVENPKDILQDNSREKREGKLLWGLYPVDVEFGLDGGVYVADWVQGWEKTGKGRIYRVYDPEVVKEPIVLETKQILAEGMGERPPSQLANLLGHRDLRVRQRAQFALAEKGADAIRTLTLVVTKSAHLLPRLHAIWGLGQIGRIEAAALKPLLPLLEDEDAEVRAQAAKVLGEARATDAQDQLLELLEDPAPRVRFFAALSLGKLHSKEAAGPILEMLRRSMDQDLYLRHAGVMALVWINDLDALLTAAKHSSSAVRLGALLALRRLERPETAIFLQDPNPAIVLEAARAINDLPINSAMPQLASLIDLFKTFPSGTDAIFEPLMRRVINANFRLGKTEHAASLITLATNNHLPVVLRVEAMQALADWPQPPGRDRIVGLWRPLPPRDARSASIPLRVELDTILRNSPDAVGIAAIRAAGKLSIDTAAPTFFTLLAAPKLSSAVRSAALTALADLKDKKLPDAIKLALSDKDDALRKEAIRLQAAIAPADSVAQAIGSLETGSVQEKQSAFMALASLKEERADAVFARWLDNLLAGTVPKELQLDLLSAASRRVAPVIQAKLQKYEAARDKNDPLAGYAEALYGGDAQAGKQIFFERQDVACFRCHKISGEGGEIGPELTGIGGKQSRPYLLESLIFPNKQIAPGFGSLLVTMKNGTTYAGLLKSEAGNNLVLNSPEDGLLKLKKTDIQSRETGLSAMPEALASILSKRELRDLVEFLASSK